MDGSLEQYLFTGLGSHILCKQQLMLFYDIPCSFVKLTLKYVSGFQFLNVNLYGNSLYWNLVCGQTPLTEIVCSKTVDQALHVKQVDPREPVHLFESTG